ncbi:MAG: OmpA family protein, partial [Planctomycetota bacterium]
MPDAIEGGADSDGDGLIDAVDPDSDDDGIPDVVEARFDVRGDADNDGIDDVFDVDATGGTDSNGDGIDDSVAAVDTDGDGTPDSIDPDSDNDGIPDTVEANLDVMQDGDGDQVNDAFDVDLTLGPDADANGVDDSVTLPDTDGDGVPDYLDLDTDNDGLPDVVEAGGADVDRNAIIDDAATAQATLTVPTDTDGDGTGDFREVDSDGDGQPDILQSQFASLDLDSDGVIDNALDTDGDGLPDVADNLDGFGSAADSDADGILDSVEGTGDTDGDGLIDALDTDSDNDGIPDAVEAVNFEVPVDTDGDGIPDYRDTDSDGDGISDALEGNNDFNGNGVPDFREREGQLETAVEGFGGGGSLGWTVLLMLLAVYGMRRYSRAQVASALMLLLVTATVSRATLADENCALRECWYAGVGFGYSYVSPDESAQNFFHDTSENHDGGFGLFVGKYLDDHWFGELRYTTLGEAGLTNRNPAIAAAFPDAAIDYTVPSLMAGYRFRPEASLSPFVRAGLSFISNDASGGPIDFDRQNSMQVAFGGGADYALNERWFVRGDIDWYDRDAWFAGLYIGASFGERAPRRAAAIEPVVVPKKAPVPLPQPAPKPIPEPAAPDEDGDGVADTQDACPGTPAGTRVDDIGCVPAADYDWPTVRFAYKSDDLTPDSEQKLRDAAAWLAVHPDVFVELGGHTDSVGGQRYNQPLSERRARQVLDYLVELGVPSAQLSATGYGQLQPIAGNDTDEGRALNRRVELKRVGVDVPGPSQSGE